MNEMASQIRTIDDLMRATYEGNYALAYMRGKTYLGDAGARPGFGSLEDPGVGRGLPKTDLLKADDPLLTTKTNYYNPIYGKTAIDWLNQEADIWRLLPKTTYQAKGGYVRVITAEAVNFSGQLETAALLGDTDIPTLKEVDYTDPAVMYNHWNSSLMAQLKSRYQDSPNQNTAEFLKEYFAKQHPRNINEWLGKDTDTPAAGGGNFDNYIESIDRVASNAAESALLSVATDNDIYNFDRSAGEAEAYVDLNGGVLRDLQLGDIDDMIAECKKFSANRNFIMLTDETQLNTIEALESVKHRIVSDKYFINTTNGVNTREGLKVGFSVSEYRGAGISVPIFTSQHVNATGGGNGNIYLFDLDHLEIRVALPTVYMDTENQDFLILDKMFYKYMYLTVAQLIADKFACHGAIKYLN